MIDSQAKLCQHCRPVLPEGYGDWALEKKTVNIESFVTADWLYLCTVCQVEKYPMQIRKYASCSLNELCPILIFNEASTDFFFCFT